MFAHRTLERVHRDVLAGHMRGDDFAVVDQQARLALNDFAKAPVRSGKFGNQVVQDQQRRGGHGSARQRGVRAGHGVLNGVGK